MTLITTGASLVGVGGGETGDGSEAGQEGVDDPLRPLGVAIDKAEEEEEVVEAAEVDETLELEEQSDPHREPDSRRWLSMCDVNAAAVL